MPTHNHKARRLFNRIKTLQTNIDELKAVKLHGKAGQAIMAAVAKMRADQIAALEEQVERYTARLKKLVDGGANPFV
jgi:uncharacterized small protein (DUF1192 family)